jgi:hypothetical protein
MTTNMHTVRKRAFYIHFVSFWLSLFFSPDDDDGSRFSEMPKKFYCSTKPLIQRGSSQSPV